MISNRYGGLKRGHLQTLDLKNNTGGTFLVDGRFYILVETSETH